MYEVLYNSCYGGFSFPRTFVEKVFALYPPHTDLGKLLWENDTIAKFILPDEEPNENAKRHYKIKEYQPFCEGYWIAVCESITDGEYRYTCNSYITDKEGNYYFLSYRPHRRVWRAAPEIIALAKEENLVNVTEEDENNETHDLSIAKIPDHYDYHIKEYDGMESVSSSCPVEKILTDMVRIITTGDRDSLHPLTKKLIEDGETVRNVLYPNY